MDDRQAHVSLEELERFISRLQQFQQQVDGFDKELQQRLMYLGETFEDDAFHEFCQQVEESRARIHHFMDGSSVMVPKMKKDLDTLSRVRELDSASKQRS